MKHKEEGRLCLSVFGITISLLLLGDSSDQISFISRLNLSIYFLCMCLYYYNLRLVIFLLQITPFNVVQKRHCSIFSKHGEINIHKYTQSPFLTLVEYHRNVYIRHAKMLFRHHRPYIYVRTCTVFSYRCFVTEFPSQQPSSTYE